MSASSVGQVVCESILIIQLHSFLLDKKRSITFVGAMGCSLSHKCNSITFVGCITFVVVTVVLIECAVMMSFVGCVEVHWLF